MVAYEKFAALRAQQISDRDGARESSGDGECLKALIVAASQETGRKPKRIRANLGAASANLYSRGGGGRRPRA